jgi:hypothetical protein
MKLKFPIQLNELLFFLDREKNNSLYQAYHLEIYGNGHVTYYGIENVRLNGTQSNKITLNEVQNLFEKAMEYNLLDLKNNYALKNVYKLQDSKIECFYENIENLQNTCLEIRIGKIIKKIHVYQGAPIRLIEFQNLIDEISNVNKWI